MVEPVYPLTGLRFELSFTGGKPVGSFSECTGLSVKVDAFTLREGGENGFEHQLPDKVSHPPLVLKRGVTRNGDLFDWVRTFGEQSKVELKDVQIDLKLPDGTSAVRWTAKNAYPMKWDGPSLNAVRGEVAIESIELAHQGLTKSSSPGQVAPARGEAPAPAAKPSTGGRIPPPPPPPPE